jgi:hypothetical protein
MKFNKLLTNSVFCYLILLLGNYPIALNAKNKQTQNVYVDLSLNNFSIPNNVKSNHIFHLFTHGKPGELLINGQWKNAKEIVQFLNNEMPNHITHVNIYGCEFGKGTAGQLAFNYLKRNLKISVAASTNITGKDGDWILELGKPIESLKVNYNGNFQSYGFTNCMGTNSVKMAFTGTPTITGTANTAGSTYRYNSVLVGSGVTQQVDAVFTLNSVTTSTSPYNFMAECNFQYDVPASVIGLDSNFQPSFIANNPSTGFNRNVGNYNLTSSWTVNFLFNRYNYSCLFTSNFCCS